MIPSYIADRISRIDRLISLGNLSEKDQEAIRALLRQDEKEWEIIEFKYNRAMKDKHVLSSLLTKTSEDLKQSLDAEKRFIASMSHEIRTPLNSIIGFVDLLNTTQLTDEQRAYINNVLVSADHLTSLINDILDVSKIEAGQVEAVEEEFSLEDVLMDCLIIISARVKEGVELLHDLPELDYFVIGDPVHFKQVFVNLLGNAAKFTEKGYIKLSLTNAEYLDREKVKVTLKVEDTGQGIPSTHMNKIFSPFNQAHNSNFSGTGLGLYLSRSFAKIMGGDIEVKSTCGTGTKFTVHMVLKRGNAKENKFTFNDTNVIIVEDDEKLCQDLYQKLRMRGANVLIPEITKATDIMAFCMSKDTTANLMILNLDIFNNLSFNLAALLKNDMPDMIIIGVTDKESLAYSNVLDAVLQKPFTYYKFAELASKLQSRSKTLPITHGLEEMKVLLAEDVEMNLLLAKTMLDKFFNLTVDVARDGLEALEKAVVSTYDVILMDIQMPKMDGIIATQKIRERGVKTPIAAMTADAFGESIENAMKAGMDDYIIKPVKKDELQRVLQRFAPKRTNMPVATTHVK